MNKVIAAIFLVVFISTSFFVSGQEKFLEVIIKSIDNQQENVKSYTVSITTMEGVEFILKKPKKVKKFFLPAGEKYFVSVEKKDNHTRFFEIDLRNIPEVYQLNKKETLSLTVLFVPNDLDVPIPVEKYEFSNRYNRVVKL